MQFSSKIGGIGASLGFIGVILGALGAHALEQILEVEALESFKTGVYYLQWHGLVLVVIGFAVAADAAIANALLDTFASQLLILRSPVFRAVIFFLIFGGIALINISGTKKAVRFIEWNTLIKLIPLVLLVGIGIF